MKIDSFNIEQQSMSKYQRIEKQQVTIQIQQTNVEDSLDISKDGIALSDVDESEDFLSEEDKRKIELLEKFIQWLTGKEFKFKDVYLKNGKHNKAAGVEGKDQGLIHGKGHMYGRRLPQVSNESVAMRIHAKSEVYEKERMKFSSSGVIKTGDGREITFDYNLSMKRESYESSEFMIQTGNFHDPLVLNFDGSGVGFSDQKIQIDIDLDGTLDNINFLSQGNGFLAIDKNDNGTIDDGTELFGPQTNNGFAELSDYDHDNNFWIDENDEVFESLKIWAINEDGDASLIGLKEAGVGAIYLGAVGSSYTIKHGDVDMAKIASSSIYLKENGDVNSIHQIDLKL